MNKYNNKNKSNTKPEPILLRTGKVNFNMKNPEESSELVQSFSRLTNSLEAK